MCSLIRNTLSSHLLIMVYQSFQRTLVVTSRLKCLSHDHLFVTGLLSQETVNSSFLAPGKFSIYFKNVDPLLFPIAIGPTSLTQRAGKITYSFLTHKIFFQLRSKKISTSFRVALTAASIKEPRHRFGTPKILRVFGWCKEFSLKKGCVQNQALLIPCGN